MAVLALLASSSLPRSLGQAVASEPSSPFEGVVQSLHVSGDRGLELELGSGTNVHVLKVQDAGGSSPALWSRIRAPGLVCSNWDQIEFESGLMLPLARTVADIRKVGEIGPHVGCVAELSGQVLAVSPNGRFVALADNTEACLLELRPTGRAVFPGEHIHLEGNCALEAGRPIFRSLPVLDNDGVHRMTEKCGQIFLTAGRHPLRLDWFNRDYPYGLEVYYQGPGVPRQQVPDSALFRQERETGSAQAHWQQGLNYQCCEGSWLRVPDFQALVTYKTGIIQNFDAHQVCPRDHDAGVEFTGYIEVPRDGLYTFCTVSDDGSLLYLDEKPPAIEVAGASPLPEPATLAARQVMPENQAGVWSRVEGTATFISEHLGGLDIVFSTASGRMRVRVADASGLPAQLLAHNRVRVTGVCLGSWTLEGQALVAGPMMVPGRRQIEFWDAGAGQWSSEPSSAVAGSVSGLAASTNRSVLTTVAEVKRLSREQWRSGYPVDIRGVVTTVFDGGVFIEDPTWSIYARWQPPTGNDVPQLGEIWEIQGTTFAEFAPNIQVSSGRRLGAGSLPDPLIPTWDQLMNGSLDTKYVELQGVVTAVNSDSITLLMRSGELGIELFDLQPQLLQQYDNALIRVRGCVIPLRDEQTQEVKPGRILLSNASICVDEPAPSDLFAATPLKHAPDLLLFDWRAGALQRLKITGQILDERNGEYFLADGKQGLRFVPRSALAFSPGDLIEAVGFLDLSAPSPVLREALARLRGHAKLPEPQWLAADSPPSRVHDASLVRTRARLVQAIQDGPEELLEMQTGTRGFMARWKQSRRPWPVLAPGSILELTGVYVGQGGDLAQGREINSFELLLNSPEGVRVLETPPWWTVRRILVVLSCLLAVLAASLFWISLLRRRVEERSAQLAAEIQRHERTERRRELEEERSRIAQDLHDDLGATLTQIRFLSALESRDLQVPEPSRARLGQVSEKSHQMITALDEIVWAINPANDSLASLATYLCSFAEEFFRTGSIRCRLDVAEKLPATPLTSEVRHHLYLAVREALNNVAKHSHASEVWLRIKTQTRQVEISIEDNGRGFVLNGNGSPQGEGLGNMRRRLQKIGGRFACESRPGAGTTCSLWLPVDPAGPGQDEKDGCVENKSSI